MTIIGLTRVRNEQEIIKDTLDHWGRICSGGIFVFDDASTDGTPKICRAHPAVKDVIESKIWSTDREYAEWANRQALLSLAKNSAGPNDWFVYFDADERFYEARNVAGDVWNLMFDEQVKAIACRLYDVYITPEDVNLSYDRRQMVGPEFRTIPMFFRNHPSLSYDKPDQRVVNLPADDRRIAVAGVIKHFGKGISVKHWEETCDYYVRHFPKYAEKWRARYGKAVKADYRSDFGNKLIHFHDVLAGAVDGIPLERQAYGLN